MNEPTLLERLIPALRVKAVRYVMAYVGISQPVVDTFVEMFVPRDTEAHRARQLANEIASGKRKLSEVTYYAESGSKTVSSKDKRVAQRAISLVQGKGGKK